VDRYLSKFVGKTTECTKIEAEGGGLARAWIMRGPKVPRHQCPDEAQGGVDGTDSGHARSSDFASFLSRCSS